MIVAALLGAVILTNTEQVSGRILTESSPSPPWNPSTPAPMPLRSDVAVSIGHMGMFEAPPQMAQPLPNRATPERFRVLTGIIAYTNPRQGFAIIGSDVQNTYLARPGQQLPDGSLIREILPKHVVLEYGGSLETVEIYEGGQPAGAVYAQTPPLPQQIHGEEAENAVTTVDMTPSRVRPTDAPPVQPRLSDTRSDETQAKEWRPDDAPPSDALSKEAQPEAPLPTAQDPADESSDDRRQRAEGRRR
jgi:type II secretory pathway component PulC